MTARQWPRSLLAVGTVFVLSLGLVPLAAAPALAGAAEAADSGFPLVGWLSLLAVLGLGVIPVALWLRLRGRLEHPDAPSSHPVIKKSPPASLPF